MTGWAAAFAILLALAGGGGAAWFLVRRQAKKLGAETTKLEVESAIAVTDAADDRLVNIVTTQTEGLVKPLLEQVEGYRDEVKSLRQEVADLSAKFQTISRLYRMLLDWARAVIVWKAAHPNLDPPLPTLPPEIADEL